MATYIGDDCLGLVYKDKKNIEWIIFGSVYDNYKLSSQHAIVMGTVYKIKTVYGNVETFCFCNGDFCEKKNGIFVKTIGNLIL